MTLTLDTGPGELLAKASGQGLWAAIGQLTPLRVQLAAVQPLSAKQYAQFTMLALVHLGNDA